MGVYFKKGAHFNEHIKPQLMTGENSTGVST
jgi:hypothetical protein